MKSDPSKIDPLKLKLGKGTARHDPRTLLMAAYITPSLPTPPASFDLTTKVKSSWGMMKTTRLATAPASACSCPSARRRRRRITSRGRCRREARRVTGSLGRGEDTLSRSSPTIRGV